MLTVEATLVLMAGTKVSDNIIVERIVRLIIFFIRYISPIMQQIRCNILHLICKLNHVILIMFPIVICIERNNCIRRDLIFTVEIYLPNNVSVVSFIRKAC